MNDEKIDLTLIVSCIYSNYVKLFNQFQVQLLMKEFDYYRKES